MHILLLFLTINAYAGAWLTPLKDSQFISKVNTESGNQFIDYQGKKQKINAFNKKSIDLYLEHGYSDLENVGAKTEMVSLYQRHKQDADHLTTLGDSEFWYKRKFYSNSSSILSWQLATLIPGLYKNQENILRPGDGQVHVEARALYGYAWSAWYFDLEGALRERLGHAASELRMDLTLGKRFNKILLYAQLFNVKSLGSLKSTLYNSDSNRFALNALFYKTWQLGIYQDLAGRQRLLSTGLSLGYWRTF